MSKKVTFASCVNFAKRNGIAFTLTGRIDTSNIFFELCDAADSYLASQCWSIHYDLINRSYNSRYSDVVMLEYRGYAFVKDEKLLTMIRKALDNDRYETMKHVTYYGDRHWYGCGCDD